MVFEDFCKGNINYAFTYSKSNLSSGKFNVISKLTENFFIDCFLGHQLQELLTSEKRKEASEDFKIDVQFMLGKIITRIPLYNLQYTKKGHPEICDREEYEEKQRNMRDDMLEKCEDWFFSKLYSKNPIMCEKLAPIIVFILVDSYPSFKDKMKNTDEKHPFDLYEYITECIKEIYQEQYLFSIIGGNQSKKRDSIELGNKCLKSILKKSFGLTREIPRSEEPNHEVIQEPDEELRPKPEEKFKLWREIEYVVGCKTEEETEYIIDHNSIEKKHKYSISYKPTKKECVAKMLETFFNLFKKCRFYTNLSSSETKRTNTYKTLPNIWGNLLDFKYLKNTKPYFEELNIDEIQKEPRPDYSPTPSIMGENLVSLICYLNDLEREGYFSKKYDYAITIYTLNKITQWITPFTTKTIKNIIPEYNPSHVFTCDYYNSHIMKINQDSQWKSLNLSFKKNKFQNYMEDCNQEFMTWYSSTSSDEKTIFDNHLQERAKDIFLSFIYCPSERIFLPAKTLTSEKKSRNQDLAFFYCLCKRFYFSIVPQIEKSFTKMCRKWLKKKNKVWSEFKKRYKNNNWPLLALEKDYLEEKVGENYLEQELEKEFGECLGGYLNEHLKKYSDIPADKKIFGGRLLLENINDVMEKYKENVKHQPKIKYLYSFLP